MALNDEELLWNLGEENYVSLLYEGELVGICHPKYATEITQVMNEQNLLKRALRLACLDLLKSQKGKTKEQLDELIKKYISLAERPKSGPRAVALLLRERQEQLKVGKQEFIKFCDIHKLSPQELQNIFLGNPIPSHLIAPIARILGVTSDEVLQVLEGRENNNHSS